MQEGNGGTSWRLTNLEGRLSKVESIPSQVAAIEVKVDNLHEDQREMRDTVKSLRTALFTFALSIAGSAIVFAFAVLQLVK